MDLLPHECFGEFVRRRRLEKGYSLRNFAADVGVSPTYLSLVEQKRETLPTAERVMRMAELLDVDADELIALAGRVPEDLPAIIRAQPVQFPILLRTAQNLSAAQLEDLTRAARRMQERKR